MRAVWKTRLKRSALICGIALLVLIVGAVGWFVSPLGRDYVAAQLLGAVAGDGTARYETVSGDWPGTLVLSGVAIADRKGPWLTLERARIEWRPLALLGGTLAITQLQLEKPVLLRQPESAPAPAAPPEGGLPGAPPVAIVLDRLTLSDGIVADGTPIRFESGGALSWTSRRIAVDARLKRLGGADEYLTIDASVDQRERRVTLDLGAAGVPGGLFARLAGMPELPPFRLQASGKGPAENWMFSAAGAAGDYGTLDLGGTLAWTGEIALRTRGEIRPGPKLGQSWREALGKALALEARWTRKDETDRVLARLEGEGAEAQIDASLGAPGLLGGRALQGTIRLDTNEAMALGTDIAFGPGEIRGTMGGTLAAPDAQLTVSLEGARYGRYRLSNFEGRLDLDSKFSARTLEGEGGIDGVSARGETVIERARWSLAATEDDGAVRDLRLTLASAALGLDAKGAIDPAEGAVDLTAHVVSENLAALSPIARVRLDGTADLTLTLGRTGHDEVAPITLTGTISNGAVAGQALARFAGGTLKVRAGLTQHPDGVLALEEGILTGDRLTASMKGRIEPTLDVPIRIVTDLSAVGALAGLDASGAAEGLLIAQGTLDDPRLTLELTSRKAVVAGRPVGTLTLAFAPGDAPLPNGRGRLVTKGRLGGMDVTVPVAETGDGMLALGPLAGLAYGARLSGALTETRAGWAGTFKAALPDLSGLYSLALGEPAPLRGRGHATLTLGPGADMTAGVSLRDVMSEARDLAAQRLTLDASRKGETARLSLIGQDMRLPGPFDAIDARRLAVQGSGPFDNFRWTLAAEGFTAPQGTLDAQGTLASTDQGTTLALDALSGRLWETDVALEAPAQLTLRETAARLSPLALDIGMGRMQLSLEARGKGRKGDLAVSAIPVSFVGRIVGGDWPQGRIAGQAGFDTMGRRPAGFADLRFSNALFSRPGKGIAEPLSGELDARWNGRVLTLTGHSDRLSAYGTANARPLLLNASLPLVRRGDGGIAFDPRGKVEGEVSWQGRLGTLWALLPYDLHRLRGDAATNIQASGRWGAPKLEGTLAVENGSYESLLTGTRLTDIALKMEAGPAGGTARIQGGDGRGGQFSGEGRIRFGEDSAIDANVRLGNLRIVGLDRLRAEASGPVSLTGSLRKPTLGGQLRIDHVDATIPDRLPPSIAQLPVTYVDEAEATTPQFEGEAESENAALALDLDIEIPGQAYLRGRGLTSEWRGHLDVDGTSLSPRLKGRLDLVRGTIAFGGRSYEVSRGHVYFDGGREVDPRLDIAATRSISGSEISLALAGAASAPELTLTSSPDMGRDQAMALFLFGKPAQSLTTLELLDVARSVASLTGASGGGGFDPIEKTRRALGLDILTVGVGSGGSASGTAGDVASSATIEAGRYVSDRVYLGVKQGARAGSSAVELNYELTDHLTAGTEVGVDAGGQVNIKWQWDY